MLPRPETSAGARQTSHVPIDDDELGKGAQEAIAETGFPEFAHNQWTVEGEIERLGAFGRGGAAARGWRRWVAIVLVVAIVGPLVVGAGNLVWDAVKTDDDERFDIIATVLETAGRGAQVCTGGVEYSRPPQCSGRPIAGWSWGDVDGEQSVSGTTWGEYHLIGTWNGEQVTLTELPTTPKYEH
jgi:hypothetical protein